MKNAILLSVATFFHLSAAAALERWDYETVFRDKDQVFSLPDNCIDLERHSVAGVGEILKNTRRVGDGFYMTLEQKAERGCREGYVGPNSNFLGGIKNPVHADLLRVREKLVADRCTVENLREKPGDDRNMQFDFQASVLIHHKPGTLVVKRPEQRIARGRHITSSVVLRNVWSVPVDARTDRDGVESSIKRETDAIHERETANLRQECEAVNGRFSDSSRKIALERVSYTSNSPALNYELRDKQFARFATEGECSGDFYFYSETLPDVFDRVQTECRQEAIANKPDAFVSATCMVDSKSEYSRLRSLDPVQSIRVVFMGWAEADKSKNQENYMRWQCGRYAACKDRLSEVTDKTAILALREQCSAGSVESLEDLFKKR